MKNATGFYPGIKYKKAASGAAGQAGGVVLTETVRAAGLDAGLRAGLAPWRKDTAVHDPAKVIVDLALMLALGGDCLADVAQVRAEPGIYGPVASDPTVSRTIAALAADADRVVKVIDGARAAARARAWELAGDAAPDHEADARSPVVIDIDATLVTAHSEKEQAAPTSLRGYGFHPLTAWVDHGQVGTGEPAVFELRPGNAGSNTAADHIKITKAALAQLPAIRAGRRAGKWVMVRTDGAGASHAFIDYLTRARVSYSVGFTLPDTAVAAIENIPEDVWEPAINAEGEPREGAWVAELTDLLDLSSWPAAMRVIVRKERPHPGAQLRLTDADGMRITAFATNTVAGQLSTLELRHRRRARCEDRIREAKDTGLAALPLQSFDQNRIWLQVVALAMDLKAWMQALALGESEPQTGTVGARRWEPKKLRLWLYSIPATLARHARQAVLTIADHAPGADLLTTALARLAALPRPG